ncbi:MAG TPA: hypothetical protein VI583_16765 [Cyclobacteriaceae bacterium]|nr:hypothetical protein [Cyclobacteriaceae bacterium]
MAIPYDPTNAGFSVFSLSLLSVCRRKFNGGAKALLKKVFIKKSAKIEFFGYCLH